MTADTITRRAIEAELADCCAIAKRLTVVDPRYPVEHATIDRLLDRLART